MRIINIVSSIRDVIVTFLLIFIVCSALFLFALLRGIEIESLEFGNIKIEQLYLKLDKRVKLELKSIKIGEESKSRDDFSLKKLAELKNIIDNTLMFAKYFEIIEIEELITQDKSMQISYKEGILYIDLDDVNIATSILLEDDSLIFDIKSLNIKNYNITILGVAKYDINSYKALIDGKIFGRFDAEIDFLGEYDDRSGELSLEGSSNLFENLKFLRDVVGVDFNNRELEIWLYENIESKGMTLESFKIDLNLKNPTIDDYYSLNAKATILEPNLLFHKELPKVKAKSVEITFRDSELGFKLLSPSYENISLEGSYVYISDIFEDEPFLNIYLETIHLADKKILNILDKFGIKFPIIQNSGETKASLLLKVNLKGYDTKALGRFKIANSHFSLGELDFYISSGEARLEERDGSHIVKIINATGDIGDFLSATLNGEVSIKEEIFAGEFDLHRLHIKKDELDILDIRGIKDRFLIDFKTKKTLLEIKNLGFRASFGEKNIFRIDSIERFCDYSKLAQDHKIDGGSLTLESSDFESFKAYGTLEKLNYPIIDKSGDKLKDLDYEIDIGLDYTTIMLDENRIVIFIDNKISLFIDGYDLNISEEFLEESKDKKKSDELLYISAKNSNIYFKDRLVLSDLLSVKISNDNLDGEILYKNGNIFITKRGDFTEIVAKNLNSTFLNSYINKSILVGGTYNIEAVNSGELTQGEIRAKNITIVDLITLNNIVALIDTIPSLIVFKDPGFSSSGYRVLNAYAKFGYVDEVLVAEDLELIGKSVDITGYGVIDFKTKDLDFDLKLHTIKNLSSIIKNIPLVGYILLGDEGSVTTGIKVSGDIQKPDVRTKIVEESIKTPINIIERVLKSPFKMLGFEENLSTQSP